MSPSHKKLVIGIDYGTTNSGVAYAIVTDDKDDNVDINIIRDWPHGLREEKIPSDIAYDAAGKPIGYASDFADGVQPFQWVKMLLEPKKLGEARQGNERVWRSYYELGKLGKRPIDVVADYLRWLWVQIEKNLRESGDDVDADEVVVVMTLPTSWTDEARDRMLQATKQAGIDSNGRVLKFRIEPEAAALFELKARAKKGQIAVGDCFIVCDAGGGTVDVVTFQVICLQPLSVNQVVVADADFCGSAFIDAEFESQLRFFLGSDFERLSADVRSHVRDTFEQKIKRRYNPSVPTEFTVPVTGLKDNGTKGIKDGRFIVKESMLQGAFEGIMTQVLTLIDGQKDGLKAKNLLQRLKAILIVGGFGCSEYLHKRIRQEYPESERVKVWRGANSWTAVVQGAVQCEIANRQMYAPVNTRLSSFHYGIPYRQGNRRKVDWIVSKGQNVRNFSHAERFSLRLDDRDWLDIDEFVTISVQLVKSARDIVTEDDDASLDQSIDMNSKVSTAIRFSPETELIQEQPRRIWRIPAELILAMDGPLLTVKCRIQGRDVGLIELKYHDQPELPAQGEDLTMTMSPSPHTRIAHGPRRPSIPAQSRTQSTGRDSIFEQPVTEHQVNAAVPSIRSMDEKVRPTAAGSGQRDSMGRSRSDDWQEPKSEHVENGRVSVDRRYGENKYRSKTTVTQQAGKWVKVPNRPNEIWELIRNTADGREMLRHQITGEMVPPPPKGAEGYGLH